MAENLLRLDMFFGRENHRPSKEVKIVRFDSAFNSSQNKQLNTQGGTKP